MNIKFFSKPTKPPSPLPPEVCQIARLPEPPAGVFGFLRPEAPPEWGLYEGLRQAVPVIDAAIQKIVRLAGGFTLISSDEGMQDALERFTRRVPVGLSGRTLQSFADAYLDSLLTYGSAVGEILPEPEAPGIAGLYNGHVRDIDVRPGASPVQARFYRRGPKGECSPLAYPERILFTALNPPPGRPWGQSILRGLPYLSGILLRIYECAGQNFDRAGNVRYAVTYKPQDSGDRAFAKDRAQQIAAEWSAGMQASRSGEVRDFVAVGDVDIRVIGADGPILDSSVPVRQLLEQITAKLSIPPFLLGLSWSSTERMSAQQADILTTELEFYRRLLTPVLIRIGETFLRLEGSPAEAEVLWDSINLQDEVELADARLKNAQAREIEARLEREAGIV